MATQTANQQLQGLLNGTEGLYHTTERDDYGRTVHHYTMADGNRRDYLVVVNLPKSWIEQYGTKFLVNTAPARYGEGDVLYFTERAQAHLFAVKTLLTRWEEESK